MITLYSYSFIQWLLFFYIYCFIGWCIESTIVSFNSKRFVNRGFVRGPILPIYGFGAIVILFVTIPVGDNPILIYIFGSIGTTILEFVTGWLMEKLFKTKYWDYSDCKFNIKGYICLKSSLFWGVLSLFLVFVIHKPIENLVTETSTLILTVIDISISAVFIVDLAYAVRTALDVNKLLSAITVAKAEITELRQELTQRIEENESAVLLNERIEKLKLEHKKRIERLGFFKKDFILAHPTARSKRFNEALEELKQKLEKR